MPQSSSLPRRDLLLVHLTYGCSLDTWSKAGILDRELRYLHDLAKTLGLSLGIISYGTTADCQTDVEHEIWYRPRLLGKSLYSFLWPIIHHDAMRRAQVVRSNQAKGSWVALVLRPLRMVRMWSGVIAFRSGYRWCSLSRRLGNRWWRVIQVLESLSIWASDIAYSASRAEVEEYKSGLGGIAKKVQVVPNWVYEDVATRNWDSSDGIVLSIGRPVSQKRPDLFMAVARLLPQFKFVWVGAKEGDSGFSSLPTNVVLKPRLPHSDVLLECSRADVYLALSDFEGMPKALIEAAIGGCIAIGRNSPGVRDVLESIEGLVCDEAPTEIAECIHRVISDAEHRRERAQRISTLARANYGRSTVIQLERETLT